MNFKQKITAKYEVSSKYKMSKTYQTWDEAALESGATDDQGFEYQDKEFDSLYELATELRNNGATEPSQGPGAHPKTWYSTHDDEIDYKTGDRTQYSFHPEGLTQDDAEQLLKWLKMSQAEFNKEDPELKEPQFNRGQIY